MRSENEAINRLLNVKSKVSCHYFIKKSGKIILMVPINYVAWHAGKSNWKNDKSLNNNSIGIEISNKGHNHGYEKFSNNQILPLIDKNDYQDQLKPSNLEIEQYYNNNKKLFLQPEKRDFLQFNF